MEHTAQTRSITDRLLRIMALHKRLEGLPVAYGPGLRLTPGEMHAVQAIGDHEGINVKGLGDHFGITKSAASQMAARLARQGLVRKERALHGNKEVRLVLTEDGRRAHHAHETVHDRRMAELFERLARFSEPELGTAAAVLDVVLDSMTERLARLLARPCPAARDATRGDP